MSQDIAIQLGREALFMVMLVSAPMLGLGLIVGVAVSIFQATTQIQEQTLVFVPKSSPHLWRFLSLAPGFWAWSSISPAISLCPSTA